MSTPQRSPLGPSPDRQMENRHALSAGASPGSLHQTRQHGESPRRSHPWGKLAIAGSFLFSFSVIGWAFSRPFISQSKGPGTADTSQLDGRGLKGRLTSAQYIEYARRLDRDLNAQRNRMQRPEVSQASERVRSEQWKARMLDRKRHLDRMRQESGQKQFEKGSLEWQTEQDFLKVLDDTHPGL